MRSRWAVGTASIVGLLIIFIFQKTDFLHFLGIQSSGISQFIITRSLRFIANDILTICLIYALFGERKYVVFAFYVQLVGLVFILLPYFVIKINYPNYNGPMVNFIHRLVLNPLLLLLLIPAFYYQKYLK